MALRIRKNGDVKCAANSSPEEGDIYIDDRAHNKLFEFVENELRQMGFDPHGTPKKKKPGSKKDLTDNWPTKAKLTTE